MLDKQIQRIRYSVGNGLRALTRPWRQWTITPDQATTIFACGFGADGWHHLRRTLAEIDADPELAVEGTTLWRYLRDFTPQGISELVDETVQPLPLFVYPWGTFRQRVLETEKSAETSRFCGPSDDAFIRNEFEHTKSLYRLMQQNGYQPTTFPNSFIGGTWLLAADGRRRFIVLQGNHRMAILAHLGLRNIAVRTIPGNLATIRESESNKWPLVMRGDCSESDAIAIFRHFFDQSGFCIAERLNERSRRKAANPVSHLKKRPA